MNTDPNLNDYPKLVAPDVVYEHKDALKKKTTVIPLYVKVISAAAAVALLVGLFWRHSATPEQTLMAEMKPIEMVRIPTEASLRTSGERAHFTWTPSRNKATAKQSTPSNIARQEEVQTAPSERETLPLLAAMSPCAAPTLSGEMMSNDQTILSQDPTMMETARVLDFYNDLSFAKKGVVKMTDGQYYRFSDMLLEGWRSMKQEIAQLNESVAASFSNFKDFNESAMQQLSELKPD